MRKARTNSVSDGLGDIFKSSDDEYMKGIQIIDGPQPKRIKTKLEEEDQKQVEEIRTGFMKQVEWQKKIDKATNACFYFDIIFNSESERNDFCKRNKIILKDDMYLFADQIDSIILRR